MNDRAIYVSSISSWEIAMLSSRGRLQLTINVADWVAAAESLPFVCFIPVNNRIALKSVSLPDFAWSDPADRIIIATTLSMRATLITKDRRILHYSKRKESRRRKILQGEHRAEDGAAKKCLVSYRIIYQEGFPMFNILIVKFGALGDVIRTSYVLPGLYRKYRS